MENNKVIALDETAVTQFLPDLRAGISEGIGISPIALSPWQGVWEPGGILVGALSAGSLAEEIGFQPGDILVFAGEEVPPAVASFEDIQAEAIGKNLGSRGDLLDYCRLVSRVQSGEKVDIFALRPVNVGVKTTTIGLHMCRGQFNGDPLACANVPYIHISFDDPSEIADWYRRTTEMDAPERYQVDVRDGKLWLKYETKEVRKAYIFIYGAQSFNNVYLETKTTFVDGNNTEVLLFCQISSDENLGTRLYGAKINRYGIWSIGPFSPTLKFLGENGGLSNFIQPGGGTNKMAIKCENKKVSLFINDILISTAPLEQLESGTMGVAFNQFDRNLDPHLVIEVNFDYFLISEP
jgi:hypothetical protein